MSTKLHVDIDKKNLFAKILRISNKIYKPKYTSQNQRKLSVKNFIVLKNESSILVD